MSLWQISGECVAVADPELRFTPSGLAVCSLRVVTNDSKRGENGGWEKGDPCFLTLTVWRDQAEHMAETVQKGDTLVVRGQLEQREYTTDAGEKRTSYQIKFGPQDYWGVSGRWSAWTKQEKTSSGGSTQSDPWGSPHQTDEPPF